MKYFLLHRLKLFLKYKNKWKTANRKQTGLQKMTSIIRKQHLPWVKDQLARFNKKKKRRKAPRKVLRWSPQQRNHFITSQAKLTLGSKEKALLRAATRVTDWQRKEETNFSAGWLSMGLPNFWTKNILNNNSLPNVSKKTRSDWMTEDLTSTSQIWGMSPNFLMKSGLTNDQSRQNPQKNSVVTLKNCYL